MENDPFPVLDDNSYSLSEYLEGLLQDSSPPTLGPLMVNQGQSGMMMPNSDLPSSSRSSNLQMQQFAEAVNTGTQPLCAEATQTTMQPSLSGQVGQESLMGIMQSPFDLSPSSRVPNLQFGQEYPQFENPESAGLSATMPPLVLPVSAGAIPPRMGLMLSELIQGQSGMMQRSSLPSSSRDTDLQTGQESAKSVLGNQQSEQAVNATMQPLIIQLIVPQQLIPQLVEPLAMAVRSTLQPLISELAEETKQTIRSSVLRASLQQAEPSDPSPRILELHFVGNLPETLFTYEKIPKGLLKVELRDRHGSRIEEGPESSARVRFVVLKGGFAVDHKADWPKEEFDRNMVEPRKDKAALLTGRKEIYLVKGIAEVYDLAFTDITSKLSHGEDFKLGAELVGGGAREAVTKGTVKVYINRHKSNIKGPLSLEDSPSCLKHIKEKNNQKLAEANIHTVKDLLQLYHTDAGKLQQILGTSENRLSETVKSAESCPLTKEYYLYNDETEGVRLILDSVFNVKVAHFRGETFKAYQALDDSEKKRASEVRVQAYQKREQLPRTDQRRPKWISIRAISVFLKVAPRDSFDPNPRPARRQRCH